MIKSILAFLIFLVSACGTFETVNIGPQDDKTPPTIDDKDDGVPEVLPDTDSDSEDDLDRQPQWSSDKLYKGMPQEQVEDLLGIPTRINVQGTAFGNQWIYRADDFLFCANSWECLVTIDKYGELKDVDYIDAEWIHITSF